MKKIIILALLLCVSAFSNSDYLPSPGVSQSQEKEYRSSFFMSFDVGYLHSFSTKKTGFFGSVMSRDLDLGYINALTRGSYSGNGFGTQAKFGVLIKQLVAVYALAGAFETSGTYDVEANDSTGAKKTFHFNDASGNHAYGGLGVQIYPFRDDTEGSMGGFYVGFGVALDIGGISYELEDGVGSTSSHLQIELGKEFDVARRWKLGVGLIGARISHMNGDEYSEYSLHLNFHVTRR